MRKFENFCKALENLKDIFNYEEPYGNVEMTGMVGLFEICFEQAWKAMKEILEAAGYSEILSGSQDGFGSRKYLLCGVGDDLLRETRNRQTDLSASDEFMRDVHRGDLRGTQAGSR